MQNHPIRTHDTPPCQLGAQMCTRISDSGVRLRCNVVSIEIYLRTVRVVFYYRLASFLCALGRWRLGRGRRNYTHFHHRARAHQHIFLPFVAQARIRIFLSYSTLSLRSSIVVHLTAISQPHVPPEAPDLSSWA